MRVVNITPKIAAQVTGGRYFGPESTMDTLITSHVLDNREVAPGSMFYCIRGERNDGHRFAAAALESGAVCCFAERSLDCQPYILVDSVQKALQDLAAWYRNFIHIPIVAVVGSVGKTTAKDMIASVLSEHYSVHKTPKNLNSQLGVPLTVLAIEPEHEAAVIEIGISEFGQMDKLGHVVRPDITVFTSVAACHLEFLGDLGGVLRAKSEIFPHTADWLVLSGDDERLAALHPRTHTIHFGISANCDYRVEMIDSLGFDGTRFLIHTPDACIPGMIRSYGGHLPFAAAGAAAVGELLGMVPEEISRGFSHFIPTEGRANVHKTGKITIIDDSYNASPASVHQALLSLCELPGRHVAILGDMKELGPTSAVLHRDLGRFSASLPLRLVCCGPEAEEIRSGAVSAGGTAVWYPTLEALLPALSGLIRAGDLILVKASHSMSFGRIVDELCALGEML